MAELKEFEVIRTCRSDGVDSGPGYWPVTAPAAPNKKASKEAAEKTPRAKPQMVRLAEDDPRFAEWKIKLGILLKQELSPAPDEGKSWYVEFPRGYWLYEKSKHLWVSGYPIKTKLFKSPQEFGVHLLWLISTSGEYADCCCVHCNAPSPPKATLSEEPAATVPAEAAGKPAAETSGVMASPVPPPPAAGQATQKPAGLASRPPPAPPAPLQPTQPVPSSTPIASGPNTAAGGSTLSLQGQQPQGLAAQAQAPSQSQPGQAQATHPQWLLKAPHTFRAGELVWYQTGNTWRLGVVAAPGSGTYELLPLGHGVIVQANVTKPESDLRPFHCYSVPSVDVAELKGKTFDDVSWESVFASAGSDAVRRDQINLDASKLAASKIDASYSLWTRRADDAVNKTTTYYGCFFGAERIEVGDCVRVVQGAHQTAIMGLCHIFTAHDLPGQVFFRGHVYQLVKGGPDVAASPGATVVAEDKVPLALRDELQWRRSIAPAQQWCALLVRDNVTLKEPSIRGRFYPTHRLLPLYNAGEFRSLVQSGQLRDQHVYLNNRMDGFGRYIGRRWNRMDTLGKSVAGTAALSVEPYVVEEPSA